MDEDKAKSNVMQLIRNHTDQEESSTEKQLQESIITMRGYFENACFENCQITVINKIIVKQ